jgi:hypothetical protein
MPRRSRHKHCGRIGKNVGYGVARLLVGRQLQAPIIDIFRACQKSGPGLGPGLGDAGGELDVSVRNPTVLDAG